MKTSPVLKSNAARNQRDRIARRAAAIKAHWSARERQERAIMAANLQRLLVAKIVASVCDSQAA
ncbi:MAG TPA: hypothetical protein VG826_35815 [Pirellulales bacterium]|nr:hypothetical protein [Pirellulales bacterium]